jgi:hypothetical protein
MEDDPMRHFYMLLITFLIFTFIYRPSFLLGYDDETTHRRININAVEQSSINNALIENLGFSDGIEEKIKGKNAKWWIEEGGEREDDEWTWEGPPFRYLRHFHDPLNSPWNTAGLGGFDSSLEWAQENYLLNPYSWPAARYLFYNSLVTGSDDYYAKMFRSLGQLMHLVSDKAVPAHVRNDPHLIEDSYETWAENNYDKEQQGIINYTGINVGNSIFTRADLDEAPKIPISALWDQNIYEEGDDPSATLSGAGLSEYTNANFLSDDAMFNKYTYPNLSETNYDENIWLNPEEVDADDGEVDHRIYFRKNTGEPIEHFMAASYWYYQLYIWNLPELRYALILDKKCYRDYAAKLVPRAVGYSAALLNYFFRGTLEITAPDSFLYGIIDGSISPHEFTSIKTKVRNTTPNEAMQAGTLVAVAKHKKRIDYEEDLSTDPPQPNSREENYSYSVSSPIEIESLSDVEPEAHTFDFTNDPIPAGITDLYLQVVFKGTLGNEKDIAVAVGMKDLMEPMHFTNWNATDWVYVNDSTATGRPYGILVTGQQIRENEALFDAADINDNEILNEVSAGEAYIDPYSMTRELGFYPVGGNLTEYQAVYTDMAPGRYGKIIILMDTPSFTFQVHTVSSEPQMDKAPHFEFSAPINQDDENGVFQNTQVYGFRETRQHLWSARAWCIGDTAGLDSANWPPPGNDEPFPATEINP